MKVNFVICLALLLMLGATSRAEPAGTVADDATFNLIARGYGQQLEYYRKIGLPLEINTEMIRSTLRPFSNLVSVKSSKISLRWNPREDQPGIWLGNQTVKTTWSTDSLGRLTFANGLASGYIDICGSYLLVQISLPSGENRLVIQPIPSNGAVDNVIPAEKSCMCGGTNTQCADYTDCYNGQSCPSGNNKCVYACAPSAPPPSCPACPIEATGIGLAIAFAKFVGVGRRCRF